MASTPWQCNQVDQGFCFRTTESKVPAAGSPRHEGRNNHSPEDPRGRAAAGGASVAATWKGGSLGPSRLPPYPPVSPAKRVVIAAPTGKGATDGV